MINFAALAATFVLIFVSELPDKTAVAGLVLGTRFGWRWIFAGMAAAFATHVVIAVAAGSLLTVAPRRAADGVVAALFAFGAVLIWREGRTDAVAEVEAEIIAGADGTAATTGAAGTGTAEDASATGGASFWRVAGLGYGVIFLAEWGDLTQIMTANLAARYASPLSVGIGAVLALWSVALLAILGGRTLLRVLPIGWITRAAAVVMTALAVVSAVAAVRG